jgi:hypothetical protein
MNAAARSPHIVGCGDGGLPLATGPGDARDRGLRRQLEPRVALHPRRP